MAEGRFFTGAEVAASERVAVLGYGPRKDLFPYLDPIGKTLRIYGKPYRIVGAMAERKHIVGALGDNYVVVPWSAFEKDGLHAGFEDRNIAVTVEDGWDTDTVLSNVVGTVRQVRRLRPDEANDFDVVASETYGDIVDKVTGGIALVLVVLSSIGLMVGGIGVMNIMLISVAERTREIGVRMALGARRRDVLMQVLIEAGDPDRHRRPGGHRPGLPGVLGHDPPAALPLHRARCPSPRARRCSRWPSACSSASTPPTRRRGWIPSWPWGANRGGPKAAPCARRPGCGCATSA